MNYKTKIFLSDLSSGERGLIRRALNLSEKVQRCVDFFGKEEIFKRTGISEDTIDQMITGIHSWGSSDLLAINDLLKKTYNVTDN